VGSAANLCNFCFYEVLPGRGTRTLAVLRETRLYWTVGVTIVKKREREDSGPWGFDERFSKRDCSERERKSRDRQPKCFLIGVGVIGRVELGGTYEERGDALVR